MKRGRDMKFSKKLCLLFLPFLLVGCGGNNGQYNESIKVNDSISGELLNKVFEKAIYNFNLIKSWSSSINEVADTREIDSTGTYSSNKVESSGLVEGNVLKESSYTSSKEIAATLDKDDSYRRNEYLYKFNNLYGKVITEEKLGFTTLADSTVVTPEYSNESLVNLHFSSIISSLKSNCTKAWYNEQKQITVVWTSETNNSRRIKHNDYSDGFIGTIHTVQQNVAVFEGSDIFNQKIVSFTSTYFQERNYDVNEERIGDFVCIANNESKYTFSYKANQFSSIDFTPTELVKSLNKFNGNITYYEHNTFYNKRFVNLNSHVVSSSGLQDIYHYFSLISLSVGDVISMELSGSYSYVKRSVDVFGFETYSLVTVNGLSKDIDLSVMLSSISSYFSSVDYMETKTWTSLRDFTFEIDVYLSVSYVTDYSQDVPLATLDYQILQKNIAVLGA